MKETFVMNLTRIELCSLARLLKLNPFKNQHSKSLTVAVDRALKIAAMPVRSLSRHQIKD